MPVQRAAAPAAGEPRLNSKRMQSRENAKMKTEIPEQPEMKTRLSGLALLRNIIVLLLFAAILAGIYFGSGLISSYAKSTIQLGSRMTFHWLSTGNSTAIQHYIQAWGGFKAIFVSALIMIFQSFAVPFLTFSVISANGIIFGVFGERCCL